MKPKKKLGIIGGMGARAGSLFLQKVIDNSPAANDQEFIEILMHTNPNIPDRTRSIVYNEPSPLPEILRSIRILKENQADVIALACITSYYYFEHFRQHTSAQVVHPVKLVRKIIKDGFKGVKKIGLLATTGSIRTGLFHNEFQDATCEIITLSAKDQEELFMKSVYMENGLKSSNIQSEAFELLHKAVNKLEAKGADLIIGGCTEVAIGLNQHMLDIPFIDLMDLLAVKCVNLCYELNEKTSIINEY